MACDRSALRAKDESCYRQCAEDKNNGANERPAHVPCCCWFWRNCILQLAETLEFLWWRTISELIFIKIHQMYANAVFHFAFAHIMQVRFPMRILFQVLGNMAGKQDVSGIAAIHDALRHVDSGTSDAGSIVHICNGGDRAAVHAHSQR